MKAWTLTAAALLATPAFAQDTETVDVEIENDGTTETQVLTLDMTGNRDEAAAKAEQRFTARDKDGNGVLEGEELRPMALASAGRMAPMPAMPKMNPAEMFDKIDTDGNGSISREEFAAHHKDHPMPHMPPMAMHKIGARDGSDEHRVIVSRYASEAPGVHESHDDEKTERVIVRKIEDGGTWTDDTDHKIMIERIEAMVGGREDANGDGKVTRDEALAAALARFDAMDKDGDGTITDDERPHVIKRVMRVEEKR